MLRYLARTPGVTRHDENSLLLSFSPSTGNISVVKEIVDKLLKGYDVRLRPDFGGTVRAGQGRAGAGLGQGWGCSVSVLAPGLLTQHRECSPHTSPAPTSLCPPPSHFFPSLTVPLLPSSLQTLDCPWCGVSEDILPQQRHSAFPLLQAFLHHIIPHPFLLPVFWLFSLQRIEVIAGGLVGWPEVEQSCSLSNSQA